MSAEAKDQKVNIEIDKEVSQNLLAILNQNPTARMVLNAYFSGKGVDFTNKNVVLEGTLRVVEK